MKKTLKKRIGRPKSAPELLRDQRLDVRFSRAEVARLKALASKAGLPWAQWVRERLGACGLGD